MLVHLLQNLETLYEEAERGYSPEKDWNNHLITLGKNVTVIPFDGGPTMQGFAEATDEWGHLLVRTADGELHTVSAGDVTLQAF